MTTPMEPQAHTRSGFIEAIADRVRAVLERMQAGWRERAPSCSLPQYSECDGHSDLSPLSAQKGGSMKFASDERRGLAEALPATFASPIPKLSNWPIIPSEPSQCALRERAAGSGNERTAGGCIPAVGRRRVCSTAGRAFGAWKPARLEWNDKTAIN